MSTPRLSIVIPTRDRLPALLDTLEGLDSQACDVDDVEVVVVDNGSSDGTPAAIGERRGRLPVTLLEEARPGPASARNTGAAAARAPVVLFLGDDMRPATRDVVPGHLALHADSPQPMFAVVGRATWRPDRTITPFMAWLERGGPQFAFEGLEPGRVPAARFFYTSQISLKREPFEAAGGFDERFPFAAVEDIELGWRLERAGLELHYHPELVVHHDHPQRAAGLAVRQERVGASARLMYELHGHVGLFAEPRWSWPLLRRLVKPLAALGARELRPGLREWVWETLSMAAYARGWQHPAAEVGRP